MNTLIPAAVVAILSASAAQAQQAVQWRTQDGGNGHWYQLISTPTWIDFAAASSLAAQRGGHLFTGCGSEFDAAMAITGALSPQSWHLEGSSAWFGPWIGLQLVGSTWGWDDGTTCTFDRWDVGAGQPDWSQNAPDGETVAFLYNFGPEPVSRAHDVTTLRATRSLLIEWSADCNNDGIVDYGQCRDGSLPDFNGNNIPDCCEAGSPCVVGNYPVQWRVQDGGSGHWYQVVVVPSGITWEAARTGSSMVGGDLASLEGPAEASRCFEWFSREAVPFAWTFQSGSLIFGPWIGGYQMPGSIEPSGGWRWTSGVDFDPTRPPECCNNACGGSSNEDRLHLYFSTSTAETTWNDLPSVVTCGGQIRGYVVEWSADCNADGIVDYGQILQGQLPDTNSNGIPDGCECSTSPTLPACCAGDLNQDRFVDGADLGILLNAWGACPSTCPADLNRDGFVDGSDLGTLLGRWGGCNQ